MSESMYRRSAEASPEMTGSGPQSDRGENKYAAAWEGLEAGKDIKDLGDRELLRALLVWNRYRAEQAGHQSIDQGHALKPEATLKWIRKIAAGEVIPDEIAYASPDSAQELLNEQSAAFDALAFVEQYNEKRL